VSLCATCPLNALRSFKAVTWNVYNGTSPEKLRPILARLRRRGVTVFLMQEVIRADVRQMLREEGLRVAYATPQYVVAWDPDVWQREGEVEDVRLGETNYYTTKGHPVWCEAVRVTLRHKPSGKTIDALSYHTPAAVQRGGPNVAGVPLRVTALRESMASLRRLSRENRADAILYGGDDNVDERHGKGWGFMLRAATGLRQVVAPASTHGSRKPGQGRKIDDFRVRDLRVGEGFVVEGGGDHRAHAREFTFRN